jgi:hypothetical protein
MTNKITQNDLKMAEHLLEENYVNIVEILFRLNINGNSQIEAYRIGPIPLMKNIIS